MSYKNIAEIYATSRPAYPAELFSLIISKLPNNLRNSYLDLGCGTGELLFPLSIYFAQCSGIDPDEDMLQVAAKKLKKSNFSNVQLIHKTSEEYFNSLNKAISFDLVTAGRSFHWMDQELVARKAYEHLKKNGMLVLLGEKNGGIWKRTNDWAQEVLKIIAQDFPDKEKFVPAKRA